MEAKDNLSAVLYGKDDLRLENTPIPEIGENDVLLRISNVGICGSDIAYLNKGRNGNYVVTTPFVIGHESCGVVTKCGLAVTKLKPGDRVVTDPVISCGMCKYCKAGRSNLCHDAYMCGAPPGHGSLARYYKHVAHFCYKLPDHVSFEEGTFVEPLSVVVFACRKANVTAGSRVLVCGAGPIGLLSLMTAKAMGATKTCVTDIVDDRLKVAKELGADVTLNVKSENEEELAKQVVELMDGNMPDITLECSGLESSIQLGIFVTESGGVMIMIGLLPAEVKIPLVNALIKEVDIRSVIGSANSFPSALEIIASGKVNVKPLITHRYKIEESLQAFETARTIAGGALKVIISC